MTQPMRWRMIAYMSALFIAGVVTGAAVLSQMAAGSQTLKIGRSEEIAASIRQRMTPLHLTHEQNQKFDPLIKKTSEELEASHLDCLKRISASIDTLHAQMLPDLSAEQIEQLKQLETQRTAAMLKKYNYPPVTTKTGSP
jgi:hypothetical protein